MRIYFTANLDQNPKLAPRCQGIADTLTGAGVLLMSNVEKYNLAAFTSQDLEKMDQTGALMIERVDGLILEGTWPVAEAGYLVAIALAHQKPILFLVEKGTSVDKALLSLQKGKSASQFLQIVPYTEGSLQKIILDFIGGIEAGPGREIPNIKFTLRITPRIERYLQWKVQNTKLKKADYLRNVIEELMENDERFKKFLERK